MGWHAWLAGFYAAAYPPPSVTKTNPEAFKQSTSLVIVAWLNPADTKRSSKNACVNTPDSFWQMSLGDSSKAFSTDAI